MTAKNTTNYIFLKDFRPELYKLAVKMEEDLLITPISMLAYSTRFLEYILHDIAEEYDYDINTKVGFVDKVNQLIRFDYLDNTLDNNLPQLLIDAYNERSQSVHNHHVERSLKDDKKIAFRLNETLFYIADAYYKKFTGNDEEHIYIEPALISEFQINSADVKQESTGLGKINQLKQKSTKNYQKTNDFVKKDPSDFDKQIYEEPKLINESQNEISNIKKQKTIEDSHNQNSQSIGDDTIREYVNLLEKGYSPQSALRHVDINQTIVNNWFMNKKSEFLDGNKDKLFIKYNELLIKLSIKLIAENKGLGNNSYKLDFWIEYFGEYIDELSQSLTEDQLKAFNLVFKKNVPKRDKQKIQEASDKNITIEPTIDKKELEKRKKLMLKYIDIYNFRVSLKKSKLDPYEFQKSKKEFLNRKRNNFYNELSQKLMRRYLISRKNGKSTNQFCKELAIDKFEVDLWITNPLFKEFQTRYNRIRMIIFKSSMKNNKSQKEILDDLEIDSKQFIDLIQLVNNDAEYIEFRNIIKEYHSSYSIEVFMNEFRKNLSIDLALKKANIRKEDFEIYLNSDKRAYDEFIEIKIDKIADILINQGNINNDQLNKLGMSADEYSMFEEEIKKRVEDKQLNEITRGLSEGMLLVTASNVGCDIDKVCEWILKGSVSENKFSKLANKYWETHIDYINSLNSSSNVFNSKISQNNFGIFGLKDQKEYWEKWGLINPEYDNLSINNLKKILKEYNMNNLE